MKKKEVQVKLYINQKGQPKESEKKGSVPRKTLSPDIIREILTIATTVIAILILI